MCCEQSASGASESLGAGRFSQGRGRGRCRHCLSFHSTTLRLLYKCEALWRSDTPTMAAISGTASGPQAFRGDASSRNEKSGNLDSCLLAGGVLLRPLAIRYDVFPGHRGYGTPSGQKAPSAKRCIKTCDAVSLGMELSGGQKAPSAKRCIKTPGPRLTSSLVNTVRKHRAPKGALRRRTSARVMPFTMSQKAPSAKRCIKTCGVPDGQAPHRSGQKAPSAKRCIKTCRALTRMLACCWRQKAPSAKRCIKTRYVFKTLASSYRSVRKHRAPKGALRPAATISSCDPA